MRSGVAWPISASVGVGFPHVCLNESFRSVSSEILNCVLGRRGEGKGGKSRGGGEG